MRRLAIHHRAAPAMKPSGPPKIIDPIRAEKSGRTALLVQKMRAVPSTAAVERVSAPSVSGTGPRRSKAMTAARSAAARSPSTSGPGSGADGVARPENEGRAEHGGGGE